MELYHKYGNRWTKISEEMGGKRCSLACRTHGQKYLFSLKTILKDIEKFKDQLNNKAHNTNSTNSAEVITTTEPNSRNARLFYKHIRDYKDIRIKLL